MLTDRACPVGRHHVGSTILSPKSAAVPGAEKHVIDAAISAKYAKQLEGMGEEELRKYEELHELFAFLDSVMPEDDDDDYESKRYSSFTGAKRRCFRLDREI